MINALLENQPGFPAAHAMRLRRHGVRKVSDFLALAQITEVFTCMCAALNETPEAMSRLVKELRSRIPATTLDLAPAPPHPELLGYSLDGTVTAGSFATTFERTPELPAKVSHVEVTGPPKNQYSRGTCVAFALAGAYGFALGRMNIFSEHFLYHACKERDGCPDLPGTRGEVGMEVLRKLGICEERFCKYEQTRTGSEGGSKPGSRAFRDARRHRILSFESHVAGDVKAIKNVLADGNVVPCGVAWFPSSGNANTRRMGIVYMPFKNENSLGGHMILLVGYEDDAEAPGGGWFIFRNSWGEQWAPESPHAPGYGAIPYAYVGKYARTALSITELAQPALVADHVLIPAMGAIREQWVAARSRMGAALNRCRLSLAKERTTIPAGAPPSPVNRLAKATVVTLAGLLMMASAIFGGMASGPEPLRIVYPCIVAPYRWAPPGIDRDDLLTSYELRPANTPPASAPTLLRRTGVNAPGVLPRGPVETRHARYEKAWNAILATIERLFDKAD